MSLIGLRFGRTLAEPTAEWRASRTAHRFDKRDPVKCCCQGVSSFPLVDFWSTGYECSVRVQSGMPSAFEVCACVCFLIRLSTQEPWEGKGQVPEACLLLRESELVSRVGGEIRRGRLGQMSGGSGTGTP